MTEGKDDYNSISKSKAKSAYTSKKHSLKTQGDIFERVSSIADEGKKRSQSIYSTSKRTTQILNKYLNKPASRLY